VERNAAYLFAGITCKPLAGVNSNAQVLVVSVERQLPARPAETEEKPARAKKQRRGG
jgi:hypothetical protein